MQRVDLARKRFGDWVVLDHYEIINGTTKWLCSCSCGRQKLVAAASLKCGDSKSCGCKAHVKHGMHKSRIYRIWKNMKDRCYNKNCKAYNNYGGRGITVCSSWHTFDNFYADMGNPLSEKHELDRKDNNGNYELSNCRWVIHRENNWNRRDNHILTFNGESLCIAEWSEKTGINERTIHKRLKLGWPLARVLTQPVRDDFTYEHDGYKLTVAEWSVMLGTPVRTLHGRLQRGLPMNEVFKQNLAG